MGEGPDLGSKVIQFLVRDRDHPDYDSKSSCQVAGQFPSRLVQRKGTEFDLDGVAVELFTIGVLAASMDRTSQSLLKWEKAEHLPKPMYQLEGNKRRWYSSTQVTNLHRLVWGRYQCRKNHTISLDMFFKDVRTVFYSQHIVVTEAGDIKIPSGKGRSK